MINRILFISITIFFIFCFIIFFKGLNNSNIYIPDEIYEKKLSNFNTTNMYSKKKIHSSKIFIESEYYLLNIWASWCLPCKLEHSKLIKLSNNPSLKIIGLNYKDNKSNAKRFIKELGNPYSMIILDPDGIISIELGAYGVPETFLIDKELKIIKKVLGPLSDKNINEINSIIK